MNTNDPDQVGTFIRDSLGPAIVRLHIVLRDSLTPSIKRLTTAITLLGMRMHYGSPAWHATFAHELRRRNDERLYT